MKTIIITMVCLIMTGCTLGFDGSIIPHITTKEAHRGWFRWYCDDGWTLEKPNNYHAIPACTQNE